MNSFIYANLLWQIAVSVTKILISPHLWFIIIIINSFILYDYDLVIVADGY